MPTRDELLEEADRRGLLTGEQAAAYAEAKRRGLVGAERLTAMGAQPVNPLLGDRVATALRNYRSPLKPMSDAFFQGLSFGWVDELGSLGRAAVVSPFSERTFGDVYRDTQEEQRIEREGGRARQPTVSAISEFAGAAFPTSRAGSAVMATAKQVPAWLKIGGLGATEGALYGAGSADDEKLASGALGGAVGGVVAPVTAIAAKPLMTGARRLWDLAAQKITDTPRRQAERLAADALRNDAVGAPELQRLAQNSSLVVADLGENVTGLARAAAAKPGPFRTAASEMLRTRQTGQQGRLIEALGVRGPEAFKDSFDDWATTRVTAAKPHYDAAYAAQIDVQTPAFADLLSRPAMRVALREARVKLANEGGGMGRGPVVILDAAKRSIDDMIGAAQRAGHADDVRILARMKRDLVDEIDRQVPSYREARSIFAGEASVRNAAEFGSELFARNVSHDEARRLVADMSASEVDAFRRGALRGLIEQLEKTPENRNAAAKLIESTAVRDKLRLLFTDERDFTRFVESATDEAQMSYTRNTVLGGSPTARIQEETRALTGAGEIIRDVATGNHLGLFGRFLRSLGYGDVSPDTLDELSKLLLANPGQQTTQRLASMAATPPRAPITQATQATTGAIGAAMSGMVLGRSTNESPRPPLRAAARPTRAQLLAQGLQRDVPPSPVRGARLSNDDRRRRVLTQMLEQYRDVQASDR